MLSTKQDQLHDRNDAYQGRFPENIRFSDAIRCQKLNSEHDLYLLADWNLFTAR